MDMKKEIRPDNLRVFLDRKRGSQKALASRLGLTTGAISQWKTGFRPVPQEYVDDICDVLNIDKEELYEPLFIQQCPVDGIKGRLSAVLDKLKESEQVDVLRYALDVAEKSEECRKERIQ